VVKFLNKLLKRAEDTEDQTVPTPKNIELLTKMTHLMEEQNQMLESRISGQRP
jgi:large conductance mechanosensitive channel